MGFHSPLGKKTLQSFVLDIGSPNFNTNIDDIELWVDHEPINIEIDW